MANRHRFSGLTLVNSICSSFSSKRTHKVAIPSSCFYQHHSSHPLSGALVLVHHRRSFLGRHGHVMDGEAGLRHFVHQLCCGLVARMVFVSFAGSDLLYRSGRVAGICQLFSAGVDRLLAGIRGERRCRPGMASDVDCQHTLRRRRRDRFLRDTQRSQSSCDATLPSRCRTCLHSGVAGRQP